MTNNKQLIELTGEIEDIIFRNEANGYTVMDIISGDETVTTVGVAASVSVGEEVKLIGSYKKHPTYGGLRKNHSLYLIGYIKIFVFGYYKGRWAYNR